MPRKIIIDTDPGVDDIMAMLLAFSALPEEELEVLLLSITYGNIDVENCLRNVVSMFFHIEKEIAWREAQGRPVGFDALRKRKPLVAVGSLHPLTDQMLMADFFHGRDGLGGIHATHPHMTPDETWKHLFDKAVSSGTEADNIVATELRNEHAMFTASKAPAVDEILRLLAENEPDTITIVAIGPLTNLAHAAAQSPETFLRAKEVVVMGGNVHRKGNMTPVAEFNTFADAVAAARVYALSSPQPKTTMPPVPPAPPTQAQAHTSTPPPPPPYLADYPSNLSRQLKITLFPLDITNQHELTRGLFRTMCQPLVAAGSPLAAWTSAFLTSTFDKVETLQQDLSGDAVGLQLHDPLCIWYCMAADTTKTTDHAWRILEGEDLRVETSGQWTRGMCVVDRRTRRKRAEGDEGERPGDAGNWLSLRGGNRLRRCVGTPQTQNAMEGRGGEGFGFGDVMLKRIFAL